ncbi:hypothetical protein Ddye_029748 [Dipteronia dyeriana]|uniref:MULE transposase domain-containing protein n=1 Tax=Dipteronia dyeriana TaxID=168575 RepID=A0AAD9TFR9_9ROSI|nr:hypothetical protein Ddye_029748 [Dipteronia dyeriana]
MTYDELVSIMQTVVKYDENKYSVDLQSISIVLGTTCHTFIRNDDDVRFMLGEVRVIPQVQRLRKQPSWEWFLDCLKGALGHIDDLVFISDRHASIEAEISNVFSYANHTICCLHFSENIKKRYHRKDVASIMDKVARAYTKLKYNRHMEELRNLYHNAYDYVNVTGPHKWSRVHCPERRYRVITTIDAECIKSCLKFERQLPMLTLVEFIKNMLHGGFTIAIELHSPYVIS